MTSLGKKKMIKAAKSFSTALSTLATMKESDWEELTVLTNDNGHVAWREIEALRDDLLKWSNS